MKEKLPKLRTCIECGKLFEPESLKQYVCMKCIKKLAERKEEK